MVGRWAIALHEFHRRACSVSASRLRLSLSSRSSRARSSAVGSSLALVASVIPADYVAERERTLILMCLVSRNAIKPSVPSSLPNPDSFHPPKGAERQFENMPAGRIEPSAARRRVGF
jgi:hypothetical protein